MARSTLTTANSQAAQDWAQRKRYALDHAKALRAAREADPSRRGSPTNSEPDALDQYMHTEVRNMVSSPRQHAYFDALPASGDAIENFMGGPVVDILGGLEHIGARSSPASFTPCRPPQNLSPRDSAPSLDMQLVPQTSLSLLKKRNPNATRRHRTPKVPADLLEAGKCSCCSQLVKQCVDCNYCHSVFCREHFEISVKDTGRCPKCSHRASRFDCNDNLALQQMVDIMHHILSDEESHTKQQPGIMRTSRDDSDYRHPVSGFGSLGGDQVIEHGISDPAQEFGKLQEVQRRVPSRECHSPHCEEPPVSAEPRSAGRRAPKHLQSWGSDLPSQVPSWEVPSPSAPASTSWSMAGPTEQPAVLVAMGPCSGCRRKMKLDTLAKHEPKCLQNKNKPKRKVFNAKAQGLAGTGAEKYVDKSTPITGETRIQKGEDKPIRGNVPKWKRQSEDLKKAMRAEREYKDAIKQGKNPPPSVTHAPDPSLVPCPHCQRTFNESAAERHIPKCNQQGKPKRLMRGAGHASGKNAMEVRRNAKSTMKL